MFVDSSSQMEIELGTMTHPYKRAADPFKEIMNEFRGVSDQLTVLFKENTVSYITDKILIVAMEEGVLN